VSVVSGKVSGQTETLPLFVENEYTNFNLAGAYAAAILLAILALIVLFSMNLLRRNPEVEDGAAVFDPAGTNLTEKEA
jgi:sulfate transport system permease protein